MEDLIIKGGTVVDGTGESPVVADVTITDGVITAVGEERDARREIDADGLLVTPGFVDIHTHFDGQATWDPVLAPSSLHGVTTIAMGNCGVGFAPAAPDKHDWLISLLEGVEDIPGTALAEGMKWGWESFPEYLNVLESQNRAIDVGTHVPHAALRTYVMGERGADYTEVPTPKEAEAMGAAVAEALVEGAIGFATSRTDVHRTSEGANIGTLRSGSEELEAIALAMASVGLGVTQLISDFYQTNDEDYFDSEVELLTNFVRTSKRPLSFTMQQAYHSPERWRSQMNWVEHMVASGHNVKAQVASRPIGLLLGFEATANPFLFCESYGEVANLELGERVVALSDPERKRRILSEHAELLPKVGGEILGQIMGGFDVFFRLDDPVNYEMDRAWSVGAKAKAEGADPVSMMYDILLENNGRQLVYLPLFNFAHGNFDDLAEMISSPNVLLGLSDAGAHCGAICDASFTTSAMALWTRDRTGGPKMPIESIVHANTARNARHVGWFDRGIVKPGFLADVNVIDYQSLNCHPPEIVHDLPAGGRRLMQRAKGYEWTIKSGVPTFHRGEHTGELPGRLIRGTTDAPAGV